MASKTKQRRLLIISNTLQSFGGGERWALEVASKLRERFQITIINPISASDKARISKGDLLKNYDLAGVDIVDVNCYGISTKLEGVEFVTRFPKPSDYFKLASAIKESEVIYQISFNPFLLANTIFLSKLYGKRLILGLHDPVFLVGTQAAGTRSTFAGLTQSFILRNVREIHAQTDTQVKLLRAAGYCGKVHLIPPLLYFKPRKQSPKMSDRFIALYVGRLSIFHKGLDLLDEIIKLTLKKNRSIEFHLIGSGDDGEALIEGLSNTYKKNVKWYRFVKDSFLKEEYSKASLFLMPSRYETPGLTLLEAQSYGEPAVAFNVPGPKDTMKASVQGVLVKPFDIEDFSEAILKYHDLHAQDRHAYLAMRSKISSEIRARYSEKAFLSKFEAMLKS